VTARPAEVATPSAEAAAPTARGRRRREAIVDAATALFDTRGFHATSIDDIGAAAGISGPGLYRHFPSKDALLTAVFDRIWDRLRPAVDAAVGQPPEAALRGLLAAHVELAVTDPGALRLLLRELRNVPEDYQRLAARNHRRWVDAWVGPLVALHPDLDADRARALALAAHGAVDAATIRPADLPVDLRRSVTVAAVERMLGL
jgi:AcrR family transcriptional regulator